MSTSATAPATATAPADAATWKFAPIQYVKKANPDGTQSPGYIFSIHAAPVDLTTVVSESTTDHIIAHIKHVDHSAYIVEVYTELLKAYARNFTKSYTPAQCARLTGHVVQIAPHNEFDADSYTCTLTPKSIVLFGGRFTLQWSATLEPLGIELVSENEDTEDTAVVAQSCLSNTFNIISTDTTVHTPANVAQVIDVDDIESADDANSGTPLLRSGPPVATERQTRDRRRVEEFRLRATLAAVRAERALEKYIEKYGDYDIESSDSATTDYTTGAESDDSR